MHEASNTQTHRPVSSGLVSWIGLYQTIIGGFTILIVVIVLAMMGQTFLKNMAVDNCIHSSSYTSERVSSESGKITEYSHIDSWYETCMEDKGYLSSVTIK